MNQTVKLTRTTEVIEIPSGRVSTLPENMSVRIMQSRGDSYTVWTDYGQMYRIEGKDADALGMQPHDGSQPFQGHLRRHGIRQRVRYRDGRCPAVLGGQPERRVGQRNGGQQPFLLGCKSGAHADKRCHGRRFQWRR